MNTLTLLVVPAPPLLHGGVAAAGAGHGPRLRSSRSPPRSASIPPVGKALANSLVGAVDPAGGASSAALIALLVQGKVALDLRPFLLVWGCCSLPTFLALDRLRRCALLALTGNRYTTYAWPRRAHPHRRTCRCRGKMNWVGNWDLWGVVRWSDLGPLELDRTGPRPEPGHGARARGVLRGRRPCASSPARADATRTGAPARSRAPLWSAACALLPFASCRWSAGIALWVQVDQGFQGSGDEKQAKDYWKQNLATWKDAALPGIAARRARPRPGAGAALLPDEGQLPPGQRPRRSRCARCPLTGGYHWKELTWTMDGSAYKPEDRTRLFVFTPPRRSRRASADRSASLPRALPAGDHEERRRPQEFILPSGVGPDQLHADLRAGARLSGGDRRRQGQPLRAEGLPRRLLRGRHQAAVRRLGAAFTTRITVTVPGGLPRQLGRASLVSDEVDATAGAPWSGRATSRCASSTSWPGRWEEARGGDAVYYHPGSHATTSRRCPQALDGARQYYSEWF